MNGPIKYISSADLPILFYVILRGKSNESNILYRRFIPALPFHTRIFLRVS